jgi:hypothetical protein
MMEGSSEPLMTMMQGPRDEERLVRRLACVEMMV